MDAIKKKMQAMKVDKVAELVAKSRQLETELDLCSERLSIVSLQLEEKEKALMSAEAEMNALNRRVSGLEKNEKKLLQATSSGTRPASLPTTLSAPRRCSRTRPGRTTRGSPSVTPT